MGTRKGEGRNRGDTLPYVLVIGAETILVAHALLATWTIVAGAKSARDYAYYAAQSNLKYWLANGD